MTDELLAHELALIGMSLAATGQQRPAKAVSTAIDRLQSLSERIDELEDLLVEAQIRAHEWMVAHDRLHAGKPYDFPKPAPLPERGVLIKLVEESLYHLRLDDGAKAYHERALAALTSSAIEARMAATSSGVVHESAVAKPDPPMTTPCTQEQPPMDKLTDGEIDNRPEIAPDCFSFRELPEDGDLQRLMREVGDHWKGQAGWGRWTIVSPEYPNPPYPDGLYFEGWSVAPHLHVPPGKEAPFDYPLTAIEPHARSQNTPDSLRDG